MTHKKYIDELEVVFMSMAIVEDKIQMETYMKGKATFYGIRAPLRKEIKKIFVKEHGYLEYDQFLKALPYAWTKGREIQYFILDIMDRYSRKCDEDYIDHIEKLILNISWWDTVDNIASHAAGIYFERFPQNRDKICQQWMASNDMWLQRSVIIHQLFYKEKTDFEFLTKNILQLKESNEFFIQKAMGWALRQYSKTNSAAVIKFINEEDLPKLSIREGLKYLNK